MFNPEHLKDPNLFSLAIGVITVLFLYINENFLTTKEDRENRDLKSWGKIIVVIFIIVRFLLPYYNAKFTGGMSEEIGTGPADF